MTADELIQALAVCRRRLKILRDDNQRLWESREQWKTKHSDRLIELTAARKKNKRLLESRDRWRTVARERGEILYRRKRQPPRPRSAPWHNTTLTDRDVQRILRMPVRD